MPKKPTLTQRMNKLEIEVDQLDGRVDRIEDEIAPHNQIVTVVVTQFLEYDGNPDVVGSEKYAPAGFDVAAFALANGAQESDYQPIVGDRFDCPLVTAEGLAAAGIGYILDDVDGGA
jgi:hypothetical protein